MDIILLLDGVVLMLSGLLLSEAALPALGIRVRSGMEWRMLHSLSADAGVLLVGVHLALSWRWIVSMTKRHVLQPVLRRRAAGREAKVTA